MKILLTLATFAFVATSIAQNDSVVISKTPQGDTIRVGNMLIINKKGDGKSIHFSNKETNITWKGKTRYSRRLSTSWMNFDLGFTNFSDETNYASVGAKEYAKAVRPGEAAFTSSDFNLRNGKSTNVNLWIVRQRWGLVKNNSVFATWGLVLETNNYRYENDLSYVKSNRPYVFRDSVSFTKNKLSADYITVPFMLGFNTKPSGNRGFTMSAGVSIGYLYNSRNKQVSNERGKIKTKGNFDLEPWKVQAIGEIGVGGIKLYGAYTPNSIYKRGLDMRPYSLGVRFGEWWD